MLDLPLVMSSLPSSSDIPLQAVPGLDLRGQLLSRGLTVGIFLVGVLLIIKVHSNIQTRVACLHGNIISSREQPGMQIPS